MNLSKKLKLYKTNTLKTYKNKKLNNANFGDFNKTDYQVFLHLISKIGGVDYFGKYKQSEELNREHKLTAKDFADLFNTDIDNCYKVLKKAVDKLMKTDIKLEQNDSQNICRINVCSKAEYNKNAGYIDIKFTDDIMPYLAQLKRKFVLYNLKEVSNFGSLYTTRLYELIQEFKETGWVQKSVDELRNIFAVESKFKLYADFKRFTFLHACNEINANYDLNLQFEEKKDGRKVDSIRFTFDAIKPKKVIHKKTGKERTIYVKPKRKTITQNDNKKRLKKVKSTNLDNQILDGQVSFEEINKNFVQDNKEPKKKSVKDIFLSLFR